MSQTTTHNASAAKQALFLIEFYTNEPDARGGFKTNSGGWDINFAWCFAANSGDAECKLKANQGARFDVVITCDEQAKIAPLAGEFRVNTPDANLFIIR
jgi:hypothetical protein